MRKGAAFVALMALVAALARAAPADDAASGYGAIRPALVKVWAFDASGRPCASGTGIVVASGAQRSQVLTAEHVVAGAARIRIDVSREQHDIPARVVRTGAHDLALLDVDVGGLQPARFASPSRTVVEGNVVAVAGYVKDDELIGVTGQEPHVLFPATISARPDAGAYLELENVHVEEGLSGGAVFDPQSGDVLGVVTSRTTDARGGFADSSALVVVPFLRPQRVAVAAPAATPAPTTPAPMMPVVVVAPPAVAAWRALQTPPQRFAFVRNGCTTAVVVDVRSLQFAIAHDALVAPQAGAPLLALDVRKRVLPGGACFAVPSTEIAQAAYAPTVMTYDGRHVAMRFAYAGDPADAALFPPAATFDVDLGAQPATATLQLFGQDWAGAIALTLGRAG